MDTERPPNGGVPQEAPKPPRKPRPSEIAAKKAKAAAKRKPAPKKKPAKAKGRSRQKNKAFPPKKTAKRKPAPKKKKAKNARPLVRTERLELRLTKGEKAKLTRAAKAGSGTATGVIVGMIAKLK